MTDSSRQSLKKFCHQLPKVELHTHLNTSFSDKTLQELVDRKAKLDDNSEYHSWKLTFVENDNCPIDESFTIYSFLHKIFNDEYAIYKLTYDIIHEYAADNVKYLELRSTPKDIPETGLTWSLYVDTMLRAVRDCQAEDIDIVVRILISIDRRKGVNVARQTVSLADRYLHDSDGVVVGIDFSGDPRVGDATDYIPVFQSAHEKGLKLALHLAEIPNFEETLNVLKQCHCDRIGHGTCLNQPNPGDGRKELEEIVLQKKIPIEACMTSNVKTKTARDYESHHLDFWYKRNHPVVLCTDGKGVYQTTVSNEYVQAAEAFNLSRQNLWDLSFDSINHIFASDNVKSMLRAKWGEVKSKMDISS
ncbi:adenosine deaminase-like protein isoform X1 [Gigantopelta aegis]|uniref:adenosine deaminase-like protein isoform X1 n=1 Tax=Gigantopelta aegis TaxID=1735272 RepID=UPI001B88D575|nr:adenosine deaminase-like protein isoform X1 [Gigantopelta aegis]